MGICALAFGIGTSEVEHVLATHFSYKPNRRLRSAREWDLSNGVSAKDIILALIARIGAEGGTGHVFEYTGEASVT